MANAPGWQPDPERGDQERYWSGSTWTDRVRPAGKSGSSRGPEHGPQLHRALSAATADIDAVEDRLSTLFERTGGNHNPGSSRLAPSPPKADPATDNDIIELCEAGDDVGDDTDDPIQEEFAGRDEQDDEDADGAFAELDAALAAEEPDEPESVQAKRKMFRRRACCPRHRDVAGAAQWCNNLGGGRVRSKGMPRREDSSGDSCPAHTKGVTDSQATGDPPARAAEELPSEDHRPDGAGGIGPATAAPHPVGDDERVAKLFERVRGPSEPVETGTGTDDSSGLGRGLGSGLASGSASGLGRRFFPRSWVPAATTWR